MAITHITSDPRVKTVIDNYPSHVKSKMIELRELILESAEEISLSELEETLKWGEPSYIAKKGSTLRMDWKSKHPESYALYFQCTTRLVETFKMVFGDLFNYEGKRAIVLNLSDPIPREELKECIKATLTYHEVKKLVTLGI